MRSLLLTLLALAFTALLTSPALAEKGPPKLRQLQTMADELGATAELSKDAWTAIKVADRCATQDLNWERAMEPEQQTPIDAMFELLASGVVCWQGAEKKAGKVAEEQPRIAEFVGARARYVEMIRGYYDGFRAKAVGDLNQACKRFKVAVAQAAAGVEAGHGLADRFDQVENKTLALTIDQKIAAVAELITSEYANQKCD
jgi:hypothetical protein